MLSEQGRTALDELLYAYELKVNTLSQQIVSVTAQKVDDGLAHSTKIRKQREMRREANRLMALYNTARAEYYAAKKMRLTALTSA